MDKLQSCLAAAGIDLWGVCAYRDCLPLRPCRAASRIPPEAKSVLVCLFPYYTEEFPRRNVARYAVPDDYHQVAGGILMKAAEALSGAYPGEAFAPFVDNSPIREVRAAALAGLGALGRHHMLIHPGYGSYLFIGSIVTTLELAPASAGPVSCADCGRCIAACPTGALQKGAGFRRELCRSYITQKKGTLNEWETQQVRQGGLVWGCDRCLDACPMNKREKSPVRAFHRNATPLFTPANLRELMLHKAYGYRGEAVLLRNYRILTGEPAAEQE